MSLKPKDSFRRNKIKANRSQVISTKVTIILVLLCTFILMFLCWSAGYSCSARPVSIESPLPDKSVDSDSSSLIGIEVLESEPVDLGVGDAAGELFKRANESSSAELGLPVASQLAEIISEYQAFNQQRLAARQQAYKQQLTEVEKSQAAIDINDIIELTSLTDVSDANDANDITDVLSVIAKASELADDQQRAELLSRPFVKLTFQKAIDMAAELELQGKWLDAYIGCYAWLKAIDPNNEAYADYADQLLDKAAIVASFQDSPCETRQERFEGVKKKMFDRAIDALDRYYVSNIDYSQMASKAISRCELLSEVMETLFDPNLSSEGSESISFTGFSLPEPNELKAWSAALATLSDEVSRSPTGLTKDEFKEIFEKVLTLNTVTVELPEPVLIAQFVEAAFSALDPYTVMVWPKQVRDFDKMMTNEFTGIGIEISKPKGLLTVSSLLPNTPAYRSGLDAGDVIVAVDGVETKDMTLMCAVHKITGPKGTKVTLTIKREGQENTKNITITRAKITVPTVRGWQRTEAGKWLYLIDQQNKVGYVRVTDCAGATASELDKILSDLEADGLKGLILDLRFNPGGFLDSAVEVADLFLKEGLIVRTQPGFGRLPTWKAAHERGTHPDYPVVVLINSSSASGAEIVAGALADKVHNRAILVGERTHGKGLVQGIMQFRSSGAQLKYTMAHYYLPSGQRVKSRDSAEKGGTKDWGIKPDIEIKLTNDELRKMIGIQRDNDVLVQTDRGQGRQLPQRHTIEDTLAADPQLSVAVMVIKSKLIQLNSINLEEKDMSLSFNGYEAYVEGPMWWNESRLLIPH
jgi:carboxyl-terminal processing protease